MTIAYPDEGAWKRFHYQFKDEGYPEVICTKVRDGAKRIVRLKVRSVVCCVWTDRQGIKASQASVYVCVGGGGGRTGGRGV